LSPLRISGGRAKGTKLKVPRGTRPASERVRQAVFSSLAGSVTEARVLDLYCGSGAYGLEALSRGAAHATFVDSDEHAIEICRANAESAGLGPQWRVRRARAEAYLRRRTTADGPFDLVFADPPYSSRAPEALLDALIDLVVPGASVVVETRWSDEAVGAPEGYLLQADRRYGDTRVLMFRRLGDE
jgi:16S rRNA (guanine966-N2)-methyltransferase